MEKIQTERGEFNPFEDFRRERRWVTLSALLLAVLLHIILGLTAVIVGPILSKQQFKSGASEPLEVELVTEPELVPDELNYVEANPDAPENEPDQKQQYSFRAQQAADENPDSSAEDTPEVDGEENTQKILQGDVSEPTPVEPGVYSTQAPEGEGPGDQGGKPVPAAEAQLTQSPPLPPPDFLRQEPTTDDGVGSSLEVPAEADEVAEDPNITVRPIDVYKPQSDSEQAQQASEPKAGGGAPNARPAPRQRPRLPPELTRGPLLNSRSSASRRGALSIDATFSEFGEYQQQFYAALQAGWYQEIEFFEPIDTSTYVRVRFTIKADGSIHDVETVESTATEIATVICETAITKRSPFRVWTEEMVKVFGEERTLTVVFRYL